MAHLLSAEKISLDYPTRTVFSNVTCGIDEGDRVGILGRNGEGKSSLLKILAGVITPSDGQVTKRRDVRIGYLPQDDLLVSSNSSARHIVVRDQQEYEWASDAKTRSIIEALTGSIDFDAPVCTLSGGERRRVALASILVGDWDVLALDEPTNHLDLEAISWLADHLKQRWGANKGGLLLVTHDRWFLDEVATSTWEIHDQGLEPFSGGYAAYVLARVERDRIAASAQAKRNNIMRKELAWLRRGAPARTSKPKFRIEAANTLIADVPEIRNSVNLAKMSMTRLGKKVVDLVEVGFTYPPGQHTQDSSGTTVFTGVTWRIAPGERTGILGSNGAGKSTLLDIIAGTLVPTIGSVTRGKTVHISVLDQEYSHLDPIEDDMVRTVLAGLKNQFMVEGKEVSPTQLLERLGFSRDQLSTRVGELSGGQRRRLQLLLALCEEPNVLILDEPTNDMDTEMLTALEDLLDTWPGTLLVVSHDRYFIERVTDQQYAILNKRLRHLPGGVDEYLRLQNGDPDQQKTSVPSAPQKSKTVSAKQRSLRKELAALETKMGKADERVASIGAKISAADPSDWEELHRLSDQVAQITTDKDAMESQWLRIAEQIDSDEEDTS